MHLTYQENGSNHEAMSTKQESIKEGLRLGQHRAKFISSPKIENNPPTRAITHAASPGKEAATRGGGMGV